jgi:hypothetical protein
MKVYLVHKGCYGDKHVAGVYSSPEKAMAAHPPRPPSEEGLAAFHNRMGSTLEREGGWQQSPEEEYWSNGLDWDDAAFIEAYELDPPTEAGGET